MLYVRKAAFVVGFCVALLAFRTVAEEDDDDDDILTLSPGAKKEWEEYEDGEDLSQKSEDDDKPDLARGWNDRIAWVTFDDAFDIAKETNKPIFMLIHKTWCYACKNLKKTFSKAKKIAEMSENFVMVNLQDDEEPSDEKFKIDGNYIPRLYFLSPDGEVMEDIMNEKKEYDQYKYYYSNPQPIIHSMKRVLDRLKEPPKEKLSPPPETIPKEEL